MPLLELEEALAKILATIPPPRTERVPLIESPGRVLAGAIQSPIDLPAAAGTNWHHMAAVFNADNTWTLFWDWVNVGTNTFAARIPYHGGLTLLGSPLTTGGFSIVPPWTGKLDEVAFYSAALSASQVQSHVQTILGPLTPPASPVINVATSGNNIVLSWTEPGNWVLESSPTLAVVSWTPVQTNGSPVSVSMSGNQYFRLRSQ